MESGTRPTQTQEALDSSPFHAVLAKLSQYLYTSRSSGIDSQPKESIPGLLIKFTNTGSDVDNRN